LVKRTDNELWIRAKEIGKQRYTATDWTYIFSVYQYLGGNQIGINIIRDNKKYRIVGSLTENISLILDLKTKVVEESPAEAVTLDKKEFITTDPEELLYTYQTKKVPVGTINPSLMKGQNIQVYAQKVEHQ
jgi:hypothetical protein